YNQRVISHVMGGLDAWCITSDGCVIGSTPVAHVSGTLVMLAAVTNGCQEVMMSRFDAEQLLDIIEQYGATTLFVAPFI
ncbi:AMP-binding protein, partial [Pseudomonas azotoformans]